MINSNIQFLFSYHINIIIYSKTMNSIKKWLNEFPQNNKALLITGNHGVGKTKIIRDILEKENYYIHYFNTAKFDRKGIIREQFEKIIQTSNIWVMMNKTKIPVIVIDELEGISLNDRGSINEIIEIIKKIKTSIRPIPIICIGNEKYFKKQKELSILCDKIYIKPPTLNELTIYLSELCVKNNIKISKSTAERILSECQFDYHRLENIFQYMCLEKKDSFKISDINKIISSTDKKQINNNLYDSTMKLLYENISLCDAIKWFNEEKTLLPMMIHQNYPQINNNQKINLEIADNLSYANVIESYLYQKNEWDLLNYYGFISCHVPNQLLQSVKKRKKEIVYTKMLNKISLKYTYIQKLREKTMKKNPEYFFDKTLQRYNNERLYYLNDDNESKKYGLTFKQLNDMIKYL